MCIYRLLKMGGKVIDTVFLKKFHAQAPEVSLSLFEVGGGAGDGYVFRGRDLVCREK